MATKKKSKGKFLTTGGTNVAVGGGGKVKGSGKGKKAGYR